MTAPTPDTRPADGPTEAIAALQRQVDDLTSTMAARAARRPTGDIEPSARATPKPDTVFVQGQTLQKADYPALWAWIAEHAPGGFTTTATTLTLPDWRGRTPVGASAARPVGTLFGAATRVITPENMAAHTHQTSVDPHGTHGHGGTTAADGPGHEHGFNTAGVGDHGFHRPFNAPGVGGGGATWTTATHAGGGNHFHGGGTGGANRAHFHGFTTGGDSAGGHTVRQVVVGANDPFNIEQPSVSVSWLIFT